MTTEVKCNDRLRSEASALRLAGHGDSRLCSCNQHGAEREDASCAALGHLVCCYATRGDLPLARSEQRERGRGPAACWRTGELAPLVRQQACWHCRCPASQCACTVVVPPPNVLEEEGGTTNASAPATEETTQGADARVTLDAHLDVRVTRREHDAIKRHADVLGVKPSTWARAVLRDALDARCHEVEVLAAQAAVPRPSPELARAVEQLRRVGVNLNQVVRAGTAVSDELLREVLAALAEVRALLGDEVSL